MINSDYLPDDILTLREVARALRVDPRTVRRIAFTLGGKRFGCSWRFRWGTVMEYFKNANTEKRPRRYLACACPDQWQGGGFEGFSSRQAERARMGSSPKLGNPAKKGNSGRFGGKAEDAHGLGAILGVGEQLS